MKYQELMMESLAYIKQNWDGIRFADVAEHFFYDPGYFGYLFSAYFKVKASEYKELMKKESANMYEEDLYERQIPYSVIREDYVSRGEFTIEGESLSFDPVQSEDVFEMTVDKFREISGKQLENGSQEDIFAVWWHDDQCRFFYTIGVEEEGNREESVADENSLTLSMADYVVLSTGLDSDEDNLAEIQKILFKYAWAELEDYKEYKIDHTRFCFIRYHAGKIYFYLPIIEVTAKEQKQVLLKEEKKKIYSVDEWTQYIDEHIKDNLTPEVIAQTFHYSYQHFRRVFRLYYEMSVADYLRKRKLEYAARDIKKGLRIIDVAAEYGFKTYAGFVRAFQKEFGMVPSQYNKVQFEVVDLSNYYSCYKDQLKISYLSMKEMKMAGHTVITGDGDEADIPAQATYWLDNDFPCMKNTRFAGNKERHEDKIALWYRSARNKGIEYMLGPVVDDFEGIPRNMVQITISGGKYAVFETAKEDDRDDLPGTIRMFARCVLYGWIKEYRDRVDFNRITFERYVNNKVYQYVPILE